MPTKKQKELLNFLESFLAENGYSPSYREIMASLGYKSVSTVAEHISNLVKLGLIIKHEGSARTIEIVNTDQPHHQWFITEYKKYQNSVPDPDTMKAIQKTASTFKVKLD